MQVNLKNKHWKQLHHGAYSQRGRWTLGDGQEQTTLSWTVIRPRYRFD